MVKVIFYNLIRSKYKVNEIEVKPGSIQQIVDEILVRNPMMKQSDFNTCVVFHKGNPIHLPRFDYRVEDNEEIIITHFVGGG